MADEKEQELGPFQVPTGYALPAELWGPAPRRIPERLYQGKYDRNRRRTHAALLIAGLVCLVLAFLPFVRRLGDYILPLQYLDWIGGGLLLLALLGMLIRKTLPGRFRFVRSGIPVPVRILGLAKSCLLRVNGQDSQHGFVVGVDLPHPQGGELCRFAIKSPGFASSQKEQYDTPLRVGQYVTAIYLPGRFEKTLTLYGFLDLNPEIQYVQRKQTRDGDAAVRDAVLGILAVGAFFGALLWSLYAVSFYEPLAFDYQKVLRPALIGGLILGSGVIALLVRLSRDDDGDQIAARNRAAARSGAAQEVHSPSLWRRRDAGAWVLKSILAAGAVLLGGAITVSALFTYNAEADRSVPDFRLIEIKAFMMTTHNAIVRTYTIQYFLPGTKEPQSFATTLAHIQTFPAKVGFLEVGAGRLGWPWVRQLHPAPPE